MGFEPSYWSACHYDAYWLYALAVAESGSSDPKVIKETLPLVAEGYWGMSGHCAFNEAGDRTSASYDIIGVVQTGSVTDYECLGYYDDEIGRITWDSAVSLHYSITLFSTEIDGLSVEVNGVVTPSTKGSSISRIHWDWGDGSSEDHWFPASHTYTQSGTYPITVTAHQSDGLSTSKSVEVEVTAGSSPDIFPIYTIENKSRYVNVISDYGTTSGTGYYTDGDSVTISVTPSVVTDGGVKQVFIGWQCVTGNGYWGEDNPHTFLISGDVTQVVEWDTKYYVEIVANDGNVTPNSGWYDAGTLLKIKAVSTSNPLFSTKFDSWTGDYVSRNNIALVSINGPMTIEANWTMDYSRAYRYGLIIITSVVALSYRRHRKRKAVEAVEQRDSMLRNDILTADEVIYIDKIAEKYNMRSDEIKEIIQKLTAETLLEGMYSKDGKKFLLLSHIIKTMKTKL